MCGFVGYIGYKPTEEVLQKDISLIKHRGPDDTKYFSNDVFSCGFARLSIIDIEGGAQPIFNEDNTVCVICNGEIYNYKELRSRLENRHSFSTNSDVEVLLHLYEDYKITCADYLTGMYAFAIFDFKEKILLLGRDHIGIKPLFIERTADGLKFGSELKLFNCDKENNTILDYRKLFGFSIDDLHTSFENVYQVPIGSTITYATYNMIPMVRKNINKSFNNLTLEEHLFNAVESHLTISDVDVGIALSGGLDSSLIAVMCKEIKPNIKTFTAGDRETEDLFYSRLLAKKYGFDHTELKINKKDINLKELLYTIDFNLPPASNNTFEPIGEYVTYLFYKEVSKYVKVILSGDGGDELFGGYWMHRKPLGYKDKLALNLKDTNITIERFESWFPEDEIKARENTFKYLFSFALPNYHLWTLDRCSMRFGVEARVPYLDRSLIESVLLNYTNEERLGKQLLIPLYKKYLPKEIIERKKIGFVDALLK